jgi:hypothetical protein
MRGFNAHNGGSVLNTRRMPATSASSFSKLAVPCTFNAAMSFGSTRAFDSALPMTPLTVEPSGLAAETL